MKLAEFMYLLLKDCRQQLFRPMVLVVVLISVAEPLYAQPGETLVVGYVRSKSDKSPIAAANIFFEGTTIGTQSDEDGFFVLRHPGPEKKLVISSIGYKSVVVTIEPGAPMSVNVELREDIRTLQELIVFPGVNPATLLLRKIREAAAVNDIHNSALTLKTQEEELVLLPVGRESTRRKFEKWTSGLIQSSDSSVLLPLYIAGRTYLHQGRTARHPLSEFSKATPENLMLVLEKLTGSLHSDINFYNNNITMFGKNVVSPLSTAGNAFYTYYLIDSISTESGKQYQLRFRSRNQKNLAFNGELFIDSASLALTSINVQLPAAANINYISNLVVQQHFRLDRGRWIPAATEMKISMNYALQLDSVNRISEIFYMRSISTATEDTLRIRTDNFAGSEFQKEELELKLAELNDMPLMKAARWIADVVITGYAQVGKLDVGKVYQFARLTRQEGLRLTIPLRTNEMLWPNFSVGGYWGYGMVSGKHAFSVNMGLKLPFDRKTVLRAGYTDDLRRVDYEYNDYMVKENPLLSGDVDIANTLISLAFADRLNQRKEWYASVTHDWNSDSETSLHFRSNRYFSADWLPFSGIRGSNEMFDHRSLTMVTRFSKGERTYEDHLDRIYIQNELPVLYVITEAGQTNPYSEKLNYLKLLIKLKHKVLFPYGQWMYNVDAGWLLGDVPYNLYFTQGSDKAFTHRRLHFNLMGFMEYTFDKYISTHQELMLNGVVFNSLPLIRNFNLRELFTFKAVYGGLSQSRYTPYDLPTNTSALYTPYVEVGAGISNIFKVGSVQSVWRLTGRNKPNVSNWGIVLGIRFNF
jgi:hypothetical protein